MRKIPFAGIELTSQRVRGLRGTSELPGRPAMQYSTIIVIIYKSVLATPLWGMLYADDAEVVSRSPEQLRKMMGVIVVVCATFGLTVSEVKTEIMCVRAKGMPESTATFRVEAAGQVCNQTNEFVYLGGNVNHNANLSIEVDRRIRNAWCSFRCFLRPTERSPRAQNPDAKS